MWQISTEESYPDDSRDIHTITACIAMIMFHERGG